MVELIEKLDFLKDIGSYLITEWTRRTCDGSSETESSSGVESPDIAVILDTCQPKIVGQERNGVLLFSWWYLENSSKGKTMIELYNIADGKARCLFSQDNKVNIVSASVNEEQSLLGFTVKEVGSASRSASPGYPNEIYRSYVAEVQPQYRVFSLNIEWHTYQKVSFLYGQFGSPKVSHMLFIHHKSSIGLYHIPVCKSGDGNYLMSSQPKTEQLVREFVWCQFDQTLQRMYYLQLAAEDEEETNVEGKFGAIEFYHNGTYKHMLEFSLPLPFLMGAMHQSVQYFDGYLSHSVSNENFNMEVLTASRSSFYICYQHPDERCVKSETCSEALSFRWSQEDQWEETTVKYTICCVHGGYNLTSVLRWTSSENICSGDSVRVFFTLLSDYVVSFVPGHFFHMLDCSSEHEPVHHLFFHGDEVPALGNWDLTMDDPLLSISVKDTAPVLSSTSMLFENRTQKQYKFEFNQKKFCHIFLTTGSSVKRLAILHGAITHFRISNLTRKLIEVICQDPANTECLDLIKEYLLGASYDEIKRKSSLNFKELKLLPFTSTDSFRGQLDRDSSGRILVHISYKKFFDLLEVIQKQLRKNTQKFWMEMRDNILFVTDEQFHRFPLSHLSSDGIDVPENLPVKTEDTKISLFKRISKATYWRGGALAESNGKIQGSNGDDRTSERLIVEDDSELHDEMKRRHTIEVLNAHCNACLPRESKNKIFAFCKGYADARKRAVSGIWEIILKAYRYGSAHEILDSPLDVHGSQKDCSLFFMVERISCAIQELCFQSFHNLERIALTLGYRCLPVHVFMQYVNSQIFEPTEAFVYHFVITLPDDSDELVWVKIQLLSKLPKERCKGILQSWKHPLANAYLSQQVMQHFNDDDVSLCGIHKAQVSEDSFMPLGVLLESVELKIKGLMSQSKEETFKFDLKADMDAVTNSALVETKKLMNLLNP